MSFQAMADKDLSPLYVGKIESSGLTEELGAQLGFELVTSEAASELPIPYAVGGFKIPYFNLDGTPSGFWRYRYLREVRSQTEIAANKRPTRYVQPKNSLNELYLPPLVDWKSLALAANQPLIITEGELKAAACCAQGHPCIGLGGVWCFRSAKHHKPYLEQFELFDWKGRTVYICYDSDAATNDKVVTAENALAISLLKLGAVPKIARLPALCPPEKTGLDDFLLTEGSSGLLEVLGAAIEWESAKELFALNEEVVYVRDPGVVMIRESFQRLAPVAFTSHAYANRRYWEAVPAANDRVRMVERSAAAEWVKWTGRAEVSRVTYLPGRERITENNELNTWPGWKCDPVPGDVTPWTQLLGYLFAEEPAARAWFEKWCAYPLQHPGVKLFTAVNIWGTQHGTGKSLVGYTLFEIYGKNGLEITDKELGSAFNDWAESKQFVMGDEITGGDKRHSADRMKSMITQKFLRVNQKFMPVFTVPDCINYYFTSNHPDAFFLENTDRRFFIHAVNRPPLPQEFYRSYSKWLYGGGARHLFHHLLNLDVSDFNPAAPALMTNAKLEMIDAGRSDLSSWVTALKEHPEHVLVIGDKPLGYRLITSKELLKFYDPDEKTKVTANGISRELTRNDFVKAYRGQSLPTELGPVRLWFVRPTPELLELSGKELADLYVAERNGCKRTTKY